MSTGRRRKLLADDNTLAVVEKNVEPAYDLYADNCFSAHESNSSSNWLESTKFYSARVVWGNNPAIVRQSPTFIPLNITRT